MYIIEVGSLVRMGQGKLYVPSTTSLSYLLNELNECTIFTFGVKTEV